MFLISLCLSKLAFDSDQLIMKIQTLKNDYSLVIFLNLSCYKTKFRLFCFKKSYEIVINFNKLLTKLILLKNNYLNLKI